MELPRGFGDLAGADAAGADVHPLDRGANHDANALEVWQPTAAGNIVGVADPVAEHGGLAADFAHLCHRDSSNNVKGRGIVTGD